MTEIDRSKWNAKDRWAPFGEKGFRLDSDYRKEYVRGPAMLDYADHWYKNVEYRRVEDFTAILQIVGMERGRAAARFWWKDIDTGIHYPMFMTDAMDLLRTATMTEGVMEPMDWRACKRGANYGIQLVPEEG